MTGAKLSEYHSGYRAFSKEVLINLPLLENSDDFVFDNEMLAQCIVFGYKIGEVSCPTKYFSEASSINFSRSVTYGVGVVNTTLKCWLERKGIRHYRLFSRAGRKLLLDYYHDASSSRDESKLDREAKSSRIHRD